VFSETRWKLFRKRSSRSSLSRQAYQSTLIFRSSSARFGLKELFAVLIKKERKKQKVPRSLHRPMNGWTTRWTGRAFSRARLAIKRDKHPFRSPASLWRGGRVSRGFSRRDNEKAACHGQGRPDSPSRMIIGPIASDVRSLPRRRDDGPPRRRCDISRDDRYVPRAEYALRLRDVDASRYRSEFSE